MLRSSVPAVCPASDTSRCCIKTDERIELVLGRVATPQSFSLPTMHITDYRVYRRVWDLAPAYRRVYYKKFGYLKS